MKRKVIYLGAAILLCIGVVYSCSKGSSGSRAKSTTTGGGTTTPNSVTISNYAFSPSKITVKTGTAITWTNNDAVAHTVTDIGGSFDSGSVGAGATYQHTFSTAGTYTYHCTIHSMMANATVVVTN